MTDERPSQTDRRALLSGGVVAAAALAAPTILVPGRTNAATPVTIETANGRLRGAQNDGVLSFKGIPYAASTGGANRFMAPQPVANWAGVRDALVFGHRCPQIREYRTGAFGWNTPTEPLSEDCCVLNVFTQGLDANARRPVMFYIHGGGYITGTGGSPGLDGGNLAKFGDVVVVTINHRLNVFGYTNLAHLDAELFGDAANAGQLDIIAALAWVKANIAAFGGDPGNVTVFGQSGGGSKICILLGMPGARGLFHKAINMSGPTGFTPGRAESTEAFSSELLKQLGIGRGNLRRLQELPVEGLQKARTAAIAALKSDGSRPVIDGRHLPAGPVSAEGLPLHADVPLLAGTVDTESTYYLAEDMRNFSVTPAQVKSRIMEQFKIDDARADAIMEAYRRSDPKRGAVEILFSLATDVQFRGAMIRGVEARAGDGKAPVWLYNFTWYSPVEGGVYRAPHAIDIPFVFGNTDRSVSMTGSGPEPAEVSRNMMSAFVAFARSGDPNNPRLPKWKPFDAQTRATMIFNVNCEVVNDFRGADRLASAELRLDPFRRPLLRYSE